MDGVKRGRLDLENPSRQDGFSIWKVTASSAKAAIRLPARAILGVTPYTFWPKIISQPAPPSVSRFNKGCNIGVIHEFFLAQRLEAVLEAKRTQHQPRVRLTGLHKFPLLF
jgi:hypothetical protein